MGSASLLAVPKALRAEAPQEKPPAAGSASGWQNWSGGQTAHPRQWLVPHDQADLIARLREAPGVIRVTGASHSFSPVCVTDGTLISLDNLRGIISHDAKTHEATIWAGTRLRDLGDPLWEIGQGLINQGDVDPQSVAGAVGTSTHGTGVKLGSFSSMVRGLVLVTADGEVIECDEKREADVFQAGRTSVGALGVITQVRLQNRPAYKLREHEFTMPLDDVMKDIDRLRTENRHFELWAFFKSDRALVKTLNETIDEDTPPPSFSLPANTVVWAFSELAHRFPAMDGLLQRALTALSPDEQRVGRSYRIFPSARDVRFNEMEYELPADQGPACVQEILETVRKKDLNTLFPVEYRYVAADDAWLSPFYQRDSAAISVHQYHTKDYRELFGVVEPIFWKYGGRPHWGKLHTLDARRLAEIYPHWDDFQRVRRRLDPKGRFLNEHLRRVFGEPATGAA